METKSRHRRGRDVDIPWRQVARLRYPWSDCTALFGLGGTEPLGVLFTPRLLMRYFPDKCGSQPETNRGALRDALLEALATRGNCEVNYERGAFDVKEVGGDGASRAELFDRDGASLGTYDLVIDAMGLHSTLRQYFRRVDLPQTSRGDAAAGTWTFGRDRRARLGRGHSVEIGASGIACTIRLVSTTRTR